MTPRTSGLAAVIAVVMGTVSAQPIHRDGFEASCLFDSDSDHLVDCEEAARGTDLTNPDTDADGLLDGDEVLGTVDGLDLAAMGTDPRRKDILIEFDWFADASEQGFNPHCPPGTHSHRPTPEMLDLAAVMYGAAPVANPDGTQGIHLIYDFGQGGVFTGGSQVVDGTGGGDGLLDGDTASADYRAHYDFDFAQNRKGYFHYALLVHRFTAFDGRTDYSGVAEVAGGLMRDQLVISLYCQRSTRNLGHTLAHELGHNLGLLHGGDSNCNSKPNYNSIMNYRYSFAGVDLDCDGNVNEGPADFSSGSRQALDENELDEAAGMCGTSPINWNGVNGIESGVKRDLNAYEGQLADCGGTHTVLTDFDDWNNIVIDMTPNGDEQGNVPEVIVVCPPPGNLE